MAYIVNSRTSRITKCTFKMMSYFYLLLYCLSNSARVHTPLEIRTCLPLRNSYNGELSLWKMLHKYLGNGCVQNISKFCFSSFHQTYLRPLSCMYFAVHIDWFFLLSFFYWGFSSLSYCFKDWVFSFRAHGIKILKIKDTAELVPTIIPRGWIHPFSSFSWFLSVNVWHVYLNLLGKKLFINSCCYDKKQPMWKRLTLVQKTRLLSIIARKARKKDLKRKSVFIHAYCS